MIPLLGFVSGDSLGMIVLVDGEHTIAELALRAQRAAAVRVAPTARASVYFAGRQLAPDLTVTAAGLGPLDRVDIVPVVDPEEGVRA
jgi:hypothetical protein